jgi:uncharacterized protein
MCVLMLRGPQTPGELKQRSERMCEFADLAEVHETLGRLIERELAAQLPRRAGQKEERYAQLLGEGSEPRAAVEPAAVGPSLDDLCERVSRLEGEVLELRAAMPNPSSQLQT